MKRRLKVLVGCEFSGVVRRAFSALGHDAWSCDWLPASDGSDKHFQCDVLEVLGQGWDIGIFHPPCTYLCVSGIHWNNRGRGWEATLKALDFVRNLMNAPIPHTAIENPVSIISSRLRKPDQIIQPYSFGHDASKKTCLWLKNLPALIPTVYVAPRLVDGKPRWANQTDSGNNKVSGGADQWKRRAVTYEGIASAMAAQWSSYVEGGGA